MTGPNPANFPARDRRQNNVAFWNICWGENTVYGATPPRRRYGDERHEPKPAPELQHSHSWTYVIRGTAWRGFQPLLPEKAIGSYHCECGNWHSAYDMSPEQQDRLGIFPRGTTKGLPWYLRLWIWAVRNYGVPSH